MKKYIVAIFCLLSLNVASAATLIKLAWNAPTVTELSGAPLGYILYRKVVLPEGVQWIEAARTEDDSTTLDVTLVGGGTFALTAINGFGESDRSNEVVISGAPNKPLNVRVVIELTQ